MMPAMTNGKNDNGRFRWPLLAGVVAPFLSILVAMLLGTLFSWVGHTIPSVYKQDSHVTLWLCNLLPGLAGCQPGDGLLTGKDITNLAITIGDWIGPGLHILFTFSIAAWASRRAERATFRYGATTGLVASFTGLAYIFLSREPFSSALRLGLSNLSWLFGSVPLRMALGVVLNTPGVPLELWTLGAAVLTVPAGGLGGLAARSAQADREALFRASQAVSAAGTPREIAAAIGEHLSTPHLSLVALWKVSAWAEDGTPETLLLLGDWIPQGYRPQSPYRHLDVTQAPSLGRLNSKAPLLIQVPRTPPPERALWERLNARSLLLLPLCTSGGAMTGVLMVASPATRGFKRSTWHTQVIGAQVLLALENMRLVEAARGAAVLEERRRMAREIHDTLAQGFTSIVMHLEAAEGALSVDTDKVQGHLDQARRTARESLAQARHLVWALRPEILGDSSLPVALEMVLDRWSAENGVVATAAITGSLYPLPVEVEVTLLRAAQEALSNIRRHAEAEQVTLTLSYMDDMVVMDVQDDGRGFAPSTPAAGTGGGFGLTAMRERAEALGGSLLVESAPGEGTTLVIEIPMPAGDRPGSASQVLG